MVYSTSRLSSSVRNPSGPLSVSSVRPIDIKSASDADIAKRAYEKYEARGRADGYAIEDWTAASRELIAETFGHLSNPSLSPSLSPSQRAS